MFPDLWISGNTDIIGSKVRQGKQPFQVDAPRFIANADSMAGCFYVTSGQSDIRVNVQDCKDELPSVCQYGWQY